MDKQSVIDFFDRLAPDWDAEMVRSDRIIGAILDAAQIGSGMSVLDVGCGTGVLIPDYLARGVCHVTGVDISSGMLEIARRKFAGDARVGFLCADAAQIAFERTFDRCMIYNAFPHFPEPAALIGHLSAALCAGGRLTVAHGMSRERIDAHHRGSARDVSMGLMDEQALSRLFEPYLLVDTAVSDGEKYIVSGVKREEA